jgi:hypothetical protein
MVLDGERSEPIFDNLLLKVRTDYLDTEVLNRKKNFKSVLVLLSAIMLKVEFRGRFADVESCIQFTRPLRDIPLSHYHESISL